MAQSEQIRILCIKMSTNVSELARRYGTSPQAFSQKMLREGFTPAEMNRIASVLGCEYESSFVLSSGEKVSETFPNNPTVKGGVPKKMLSDADIERRCRYRLSKHNLRFHKVIGENRPCYYIYEEGTDDSEPEFDSAYLSLDELLRYCEELAEKDAEAAYLSRVER